MKYLFIEYPKCSTCKKAKKWLNDNNIEFEDRHIIENNPTKEELKKWFRVSGLPIKRFFNTSGMKYRELGLKDKIPNMNEDEMFELLSTDGMLVKRPIIVAEDFILTGFKEKEWEEKIKKIKGIYPFIFLLSSLYKLRQSF
ncbi:transcriptional regulator, Spx/MgsR family [Anaerofustis stercorihominis DSM 17244]|uniref:Transcriptional regulator, Spx/MgsR family n=1 Tax=Anaerofustis stercorihominis DSM 17244 TaxID=445971 RepID=B1CA03_9FIRM|nr:transcriptional regulator, Spx/MgsR family [Anaerofustis stercorihominis DSM 17244]